MAQAENWNKEQKIQMLSNPPKFEKYYQKWQDRNMGKDPKVPAYAKRLQKDAMQRLEQKMRNEEKKRWEQKLEEDKIIRQQKNMVKQRRKNLGLDPKVRSFNTFYRDLYKHQVKHSEHMRSLMVEKL